MRTPLHPLIARLCDPTPLSHGWLGGRLRMILAPMAGLALGWAVLLLRLGLWAQARKNA